MDDSTHGKSGGTWGAVRDKTATLLAIGQTRLELLGNELEVGRITIMRQLLLAQALLFCVALGVVLTVVGLVIFFWEQRLVVVILAAALVWGVALYVYLAIQRGARPCEAITECLAETDARRILQARRCSRQQRPSGLETFALHGVERIAPGLRRHPMLHHAAHIDAGQPLLPSRQHFLHVPIG